MSQAAGAPFDPSPAWQPREVRKSSGSGRRANVQGSCNDWTDRRGVTCSDRLRTANMPFPGACPGAAACYVAWQPAPRGCRMSGVGNDGLVFPRLSACRPSALGLVHSHRGRSLLHMPLDRWEDAPQRCKPRTTSTFAEAVVRRTGDVVIGSSGQRRTHGRPIPHSRLSASSQVARNPEMIC